MKRHLDRIIHSLVMIRLGQELKKAASALRFQVLGLAKYTFFILISN